MTEVKICGITTLEDALAAEAAGAHALGFVFCPSPRRVTVNQAAAISEKLGDRVARVGVFKDSPAPFVERAAREAGLDLVQLHGAETRAYADDLGLPYIKAFRARDRSVLSRIEAFGAPAFLLDAFRPGRAGGTGQPVDLALAAEAAGLGRLVLAGGLGPGRVRCALSRVGPAAVDASSRLESTPGRKDPAKVKAFLGEVRRCSCQTDGGTSAPSAGALFRRRSCRLSPS